MTQDMSVKAMANEDILLPTQMFPRLPARATFVADTNFVSGTQKMFLILFRNILCPQQMFTILRSPRNIISNNVSATMCPRLPAPLQIVSFQLPDKCKCKSYRNVYFQGDKFLEECHILSQITSLKFSQAFVVLSASNALP